MDVDRSIQTRQINYANRPPVPQGYKRPHVGSYQGPVNKAQRNFHLETGNTSNQEANETEDPKNNFDAETLEGAVGGTPNLDGYVDFANKEYEDEWTHHFAGTSDTLVENYSVEDLNADLNFFG